MAVQGFDDFQRRKEEMEKAIEELENGVREDASTLLGLSSAAPDAEILASSEQDAARAMRTLERAPEAVEQELRRQRLTGLLRPIEPPPAAPVRNGTNGISGVSGQAGTAALENPADSDRRKVLQIASAVLGGGIASVVVSEYTPEFQWAQKSFRPLYAEPKADAAQAKVFPTALLASDLDKAVASTLAKRGFTPANTLFGYSVCSDEVNFKDEQQVQLMTSRWGEGFSLGGLAGLPFAGKSGFRAYLHHVPDQGKLLVMFAPHVGIDEEGRIGALQREGQSAVSKACGAAIGAFKALAAQKDAKSGNATAADADVDSFDPQLQQIIGLLEPKLDGIEGSANDIGFVTYQVYGIVRDLVDACIAQTPDVWKWTNEVALVGGVMINRKTGGDFFQPLSFESRSKDAPPVDLFDQTFGQRPDLVPVLGYSNASLAKNIYGEETLAKLSRTARQYLDDLPGRLG
jgi:hypothetical protein